MSTVVAPAPLSRPRSAWRIVAGRELADLWLGGRALVLTLVGTVILSVITYLAASNAQLNLLDAKEAVSLVVQVAIVLGGVLTLIVAADAVSGERERRTLEPLLLAPVGRRDLLVGKLLAALSLWAAILLVSTPYVVVLASGPGSLGTALGALALFGTLLAVLLACLGLMVSGLAASNRLSLASSLLTVLVLAAPAQVPGVATRGPVGDAILHGVPVSAALKAVPELIVTGGSFAEVTPWLISPLLCALLALGVTAALAGRLMVLDRGVR